MGRAWGFDGDSAYYESLEAHILAQEMEKKARRHSEATERRASLGLPIEERKSRKDKKTEDKAQGRRKSFGEKLANFVFNVNRSLESEIKHRQPVGPSHVGPTHGEVEIVRGDDDKK